MTIWNTLTAEQQQALHVIQQDLELESVTDGVAAYRKQRSQQDKSEGTPEQTLIWTVLADLTAAIEDVVTQYLEGIPLKGARQWGPCLLGLDAEKLAFITLRQIISAKPGNTTSLHHSYAIANGVKMERELMVLKDEHRDVFNYIRKRNKNWNQRAHRAARAKADIVDLEWDRRRRLHVGQMLLKLAVDYTPLFKLKRWYSGRKRIIRVELRDEAVEWLEREHGNREIMRPRFLPMIVPPKPWTDQHDGGYMFLREPLVKPSFGLKQQDRDSHEMPKVLAAVNRIQQTEWRINQRVLDVQQDFWNAGGHGLVPKDPLPLPPRPHDIDTNEDAKKEWKREATRTYDLNAEYMSKRLVIQAQLDIAKMLRKYEVIYFPSQLDWRGRVYALPIYLNPQTHDSGKALLEFAEGKRLDKDGLYWLKAHAAKLWGIDKVGFAERVKWTEQHMEQIKRSADDPHNYRWWMQADDGEQAWQFLAACFELADAGRVAGGVSHLPIARDGSCNGLQHLSAMGRDEIGGAAVNLIPDDKPNDIYQTVATRVNELIEKEIEEWNARRYTQITYPDTNEPSNSTTTSTTSKKSSTTNPSAPGKSQWNSTSATQNEHRSNADSTLVNKGVSKTKKELPFPTNTPSPSSHKKSSGFAHSWRNKVTRSVVKRAVMTVPYGLTHQGMAKQLIEDRFAQTGKEAAYIRDKIEQALDGTIVKAREIMGWLQECATITAEHDYALRWTTPTGFLVIQEYLEQDTKNIFTALQRLTYRVPSSDGEVSAYRQSLGLPPNLVHSLDASHLMNAVLSAATQKITSFHLIHDSFGVHAADVEQFHEIVLDEFIKLYRHNWLTELKNQWEDQTGLKLPDPPALGQLDLSVVAGSEYAFA